MSAQVSSGRVVIGGAAPLELPPFPFLIDKKYEAKGLLGRGGGGEALLANHQGKLICIKLLNLKFVKNSKKAIEKFKKEFQTLKKLNHPYIGSLFDFGYDAALDRYYFVAALIQGESITKVAQKIDPPTLEELMVQALQALHYLHTFGGSGIRHNDIKSPNMLVESFKPKDGQTNYILKFIDFGLASFSALQVAGGTASCMAPEQIAHAFPKNSDGKSYPKPDARSDLYSLGVVWYQCATNINPYFTPKNPITTMKNHFSKLPEPPSKLRKTLPSYWDNIILKLLSKEQSERFKSAADVICELALLSGKPYSVIPEKQRHFYIPEGALISQKKEWRDIKNIWEAISENRRGATLLWLEGSRGLGKSKYLNHFKNHIQQKGGKTLFLTRQDPEHFEEWLGDFERYTVDLSLPIVIAIDDIDLYLQSEEAPNIKEPLMKFSRQLRHYLQWNKDKKPRVMILCTSEEKTAEEDIRYFKTHFRFDFLESEHIKLTSFSKIEIEKLLEHLSVKPEVKIPQSFAQKLFDHTEGNPLFISNTLKALSDQGLLFDESGQWQETLFSDIGIDFSKLPIPQNMSSAFKENWERMTKKERESLSWIALFPEPVLEEHLQELIPNLSIETIVELIGASTLIKEKNRISFKNPFFQRTILEKLKNEAAKKHDLITLFFQEKELAEHKIAYHQTRGSDAKKRMAAWKSLTSFYIKTNNAEEEIHCYQAILNQLEKSKLVEKLPWVLCWTDKLLEKQDYEVLDELAQKWIGRIENDPKLNIEQAILLRQRAMAILSKGEIKKAMALLKKGLVLAESKKENIIIQNSIAQILQQENKIKQAVDLYQQTKLETKNLALEEAAKVKNNDLGYCHFCLHEWEKAISEFEENLAFFTKLGDRSRMARTNYLLGETFRYKRDFERAIKYYQNAVEASKKLKNPDTLMRAYNGIAATYLDRGETQDHKTAYRQALRYFEKSLALVQHLKSDMSQVNTETAVIQLNIGSIQLDLGEYRNALNAFRTLLSVLEGKKKLNDIDRSYVTAAYLHSGECLRHESKYQEAEAALKSAEKLAKKSPTLPEHLFSTYLYWAQLKKKADGSGHAKKYIEKAEACIKRYGFTPTPLAQKMLLELKE